MTLLRFISEMTSALAWPLALVVIVLLFKRQLLLLIPEVRRMKFKEFELEFRESVKQAEKAIQATKPLPAAAPADEDRLSFLMSLAAVAPRAAVLEAWMDLEAAARRALGRKRTDLRSGVFRSFGIPLGAELTDAGILSPELRTAYENLRSLRNRFARVPEAPFNEQEAASYVEVAHSLVRHVNAA